MDKKMYLFGGVLFSMIVSCEKHQESNKIEKNVDLAYHIEKDDNKLDIQNAVQVAIDFMNIYTDRNIFSYNLATSNFSELYKKWQSSDFIDYDRIVNGQDYGNKYILSKVLEVERNSVYILLIATKGWIGYKIPIKVTNVNGKWLVDGAGDLNMPKTLQQFN